MGWIHKIRERQPRICHRPVIGDAAEGSIWQCDVCKKRWVVERFMKLTPYSADAPLTAKQFAQGGYQPNKQSVMEFGPKVWMPYG